MKECVKHAIIHSCLTTVYLSRLGCQGCKAPEATSLTAKSGQIQYQQAGKDYFAYLKVYARINFDTREKLK